MSKIRSDEQDPSAQPGPDPETFGAFFRHFERPMLGFFIRATGHPDVAADLTAETFARALESVERYDPGRGRADQWLFGIARNVLASSYRRGRVESFARDRLGMAQLVLDEQASEMIAALPEDEQHATLALASLPAEQRRAVAARVLQERDYSEIAAELRCSEAVVRQRVSRGLRSLRAKLAGEG